MRWCQNPQFITSLASGVITGRAQFYYFAAGHTKEASGLFYADRATTADEGVPPDEPL
jgi:hypothetical protein